MTTVTVMVGDEVVETLKVNAADVETADVAGVAVAPAVSFVTKGSFGRTVEKVAHDSTGRNVATGELRLTVSMRNRNNGMVRFTCDLWKLPHDLNSGALTLLRNYWRLLNKATPMKTQTRMERHFGRTFIQFDTMAEQASD